MGLRSWMIDIVRTRTSVTHLCASSIFCRTIRLLGPLVLVGFIYEGLGIIMALIIRQFFWVPHRFRYGLLVAGGWGNYGDIREFS